MTTQKTKLPEGWREVELGKIFIFQDKTGRKAGEGQERGKYKFFTSSSEQTKFIDSYDFDSEYLIFASGGQAAIHYCNEKFSASNDCFVVKVNSEISAKYVYYYLLSKIYLLEAGFKGAGLKHISKKYIEKIKIICPKNIETQKKIVAILEKAEKLKEKREQAIKLADEYLKSVFYEMFLKEKDKFEEVELGDKKVSLDLFAGGDVPKNNFSKIKTIEYNIPIFTNGEKDKGLYGYTDTPKVKEPSITISARGTIGYTEIRKESFYPAIRLIVLIPNKRNVNLHYLKYAINQLKFNLGGTSIPQLTVPMVRNLKIPLPPVELQQKFASIVEKVEKMKEKQLESKKKIDEMFNSLMQKAFRGELVR
ncbi:MAG: restriction endonuclease subunit S [Candidatus Pacearchaeota archaeon]